MSTVVNILRTDGDLLSSFDEGKWNAFEVHCTGYETMDAKEFISGLCHLVGKRKVRRISLVITSRCVLKPHKSVHLIFWSQIVEAVKAASSEGKAAKLSRAQVQQKMQQEAAQMLESAAIQMQKEFAAIDSDGSSPRCAWDHA